MKFFRSIAALLIGAGLSSGAFAQGAVQQAGPWAPGHAPMYAGPGRGQPVIIDGGTAAGGAVGANLSEMGLTARGIGTPPYVGQGTGPLGANWCNYDAPTTNATGYHYLCMSANAQGGGLLTYGAGGVALPLPLNFNVNGVVQTTVTAGSAPANQFVTGISALGALLYAQPLVTNALLAPMPALTVKSNITNATALPADNSLSAILDAAVSPVQGSLLTRNATSWVGLPPGTIGQVLGTGGPAANAGWVAGTIGPAGSTIYYDTYAQFVAAPSFPGGTAYVYVRAMTGTYPPASGLEATPLVYKVVGAATGLYGEVTVAGLIFDPVYSTAPVNAGEFRIIPDGTLTNPAALFTGTANGTAVVAVANTAGVTVGMNVTNVNYATLGVNAVLAGTTVSAVNTNVSVTFSNVVPTGTNLKFVAWTHTVAGTDNTAALQAAINFALQYRFEDVKIPLGTYRTTGVLNVGWGDSFYSLRLTGTKRSTYLGSSIGTTILASATNQPAVNFQGSRNGGMSGISIIGPNFTYVQWGQYFNRAYSSNPNDWIAPLLAVTGANPGGLSLRSPLAGVTVDAYSGASPAAPYPNRTFPAFTGLVAQYNGALSSNVTVDHSEIDGFATCAALGLNSNSQGDFFRTSDMIMQSCIYGVAIGNGQSRNVRMSDYSFAGLHTLATGTAFGLQSGQFNGPFDSLSGGAVYQMFDFTNLGLSGPITVNNLYCEDCVRLGNFIGTSLGSSVIFTGGQIDFAGSAHGQVPRSIISNGNATIILNALSMNTSQRITALTDGVGAIQQNGGLRAGGQGNQGTTALQQATNFTGNLFAGASRYNSSNTNRYSTSNLQMSYYPTVGGAQSSLVHDDEYSFYANGTALLRGPMTQEARTYKDLLLNRSFRITVPTSSSIAGQVISQVSTPPSYVGDVMTYGVCTVYQANANPAFIQAPGDILYFAATNTIFVVATVAAPTAQANCSSPATENIITATQQNNLTLVPGTNTFLSNTNTIPLLTNSIQIIKTGAVLPANLYYATFTSGSTSLTSVGRGDGNGSLFSTYYANGDQLYGLSLQGSVSGPWPVPIFATLSAVTNGSPGSASLSANAVTSGVFPLFPYELR